MSRLEIYKEALRLQAENDRLRGALAVAEKALQYYANPAPYPSGYESIKENAEEALKEIRAITGEKT